MLLHYCHVDQHSVLSDVFLTEHKVLKLTALIGRRFQTIVTTRGKKMKMSIYSKTVYYYAEIISVCSLLLDFTSLMLLAKVKGSNLKGQQDLSSKVFATSPSIRLNSSVSASNQPISK